VHAPAGQTLIETIEIPRRRAGLTPAPATFVIPVSHRNGQ
jgi:hypothetical protein